MPRPKSTQTFLLRVQHDVPYAQHTHHEPSRQQWCSPDGVGLASDHVHLTVQELHSGQLLTFTSWEAFIGYVELLPRGRRLR